MTGSERDGSIDWKLVQLPSLFIRISIDDEMVTRKALREAIAYQEHVSSDVADIVIQSALDDGIIERQNGEVLRLPEDVNDPFEDFNHDK